MTRRTFLSLACFALLCFAPSADAQGGGSVLLAWDPINVGTNPVTYQIKYGNESRIYHTFRNTANTTLLITNLPLGNWFFAAHCTVNGVNSDDSNEVSWGNRPPAPRISITGSTNSQVTTLWLRMDRTNATAQAALQPSGPWTNWFAGVRMGLPDITQIGLRLDASDPHRFFRLEQ